MGHSRVVSHVYRHRLQRAATYLCTQREGRGCPSARLASALPPGRRHLYRHRLQRAATFLCAEREGRGCPGLRGLYIDPIYEPYVFNVLNVMYSGPHVYRTITKAALLALPWCCRGGWVAAGAGPVMGTGPSWARGPSWALGAGGYRARGERLQAGLGLAAGVQPGGHGAGDCGGGAEP